MTIGSSIQLPQLLWLDHASVLSGFFAELIQSFSQASCRAWDDEFPAVETLNLNLKGTELVVLFTCSIGHSEIRTGEDGYGLQSSLNVAGAHSTLLSLWKVDDAATGRIHGPLLPATQSWGRPQ